MSEELYTVISKKMYEEELPGCSVVGSIVRVIGEQTVRLIDGRVVVQYLYHIKGYTPENGLPFAALTSNIILD